MVKPLELASHCCWPRDAWKVPALHLRHVAWPVGKVWGGEVVGEGEVGEVVVGENSSCTCAVRFVTLPG
jgi:hypothetical protein